MFLGCYGCNLIHNEQDESLPFQSVRVMRYYEVDSLFETSVSAQVGHTSDRPFIVNLEISNTSSTLAHVAQVTCLSPNWKCIPTLENDLLVSSPFNLIPSIEISLVAPYLPPNHLT